MRPFAAKRRDLECLSPFVLPPPIGESVPNQHGSIVITRLQCHRIYKPDHVQANAREETTKKICSMALWDKMMPYTCHRSRTFLSGKR